MYEPRRAMSVHGSPTRHEEGESINANRSIYVWPEQANIDGLANWHAMEHLQELLVQAKRKEQDTVDQINKLLEQWTLDALETRRLLMAIEARVHVSSMVQRFGTKKIPHTSNQWVDCEVKYWHPTGSTVETAKRRSNSVYFMRYSYAKDADSDGIRLFWVVGVRGASSHGNSIGNDREILGIIIDRQKRDGRRKFADMAAAEKYLAGRIKAYDHLFTEENPLVKPEYAEQFMVNGVLLPGYKLAAEKEGA